MNNLPELAINGGPKIRSTPLPYRKLFGEKELDIVREVFENSWNTGKDFGFQGKYEALYTQKFCEFQGGGYADAVASGTVAIYLAIQALELEKNCEVIVSPVTDPGSVSPIIISNYMPVIADSGKESFNIDVDEFEKVITSKTKAAVLTHLGGHPIDIDPIIEVAKSKNIKIIEDCSQAHGALYKGKKVGRFGDIAAFSTMFSKIHATGGCGGLVYTENKDLYWLIRSFADRGKHFHQPNFDYKAPGDFQFPALNLNLDELSCAIGISTLSKLPQTIKKRYEIVKKIDKALEKSLTVYPCIHRYSGHPSIFFHTVQVATEKICVSKKEFAEAIAAEGIWINPEYNLVVSEWKWIQQFLKSNSVTKNATNFKNKSFNILLNEQFTDNDIKDIIQSILKVEQPFIIA